MTTLYHFTSREGAASILARGFVGDIWLTPIPHTAYGEQARSVWLDVTFDGPEEHLGQYRREVTEEEIDGVTDEPVPGDQVATFVWYEVPAEVVNTQARVRTVEEEERHRLWLEG